MTRQLGFQEVIGGAFDYYTSNIYTSMPAVVVSVDLPNMRAVVQPTVNMRDESGDENVKRPTILNVPIQMPITDKGGLSFPIGSGCPVLLIWSMRGLDTWKRGNGLPDKPTDTRKFDIRDCVAIPSIFPQSLSKNSTSSRSNSHSPEDVVLVHNIGSGSEVEIRLKPNGDVEINSPTKVIVNCEDAEINSSTSTKVTTDDFSVESSSFAVNTGDFSVESSSFAVNTGTYAISATDTATQTGTFSHQGQMIINGDIDLNGKSIDNHTHSGVEAGGDDTAPFNA